jgi:hypothetical protein
LLLQPTYKITWRGQQAEWIFIPIDNSGHGIKFSDAIGFGKAGNFTWQ